MIDLVIKISEEDYKKIKNANKALFVDLYKIMADAINNGKLLPEGHGDLIDKNQVLEEIKYEMLGTGYHDLAYSIIKEAKTIIEGAKK